MAVVEYVVGSSGTGKSYVRGVVALLDYWLPNTDRVVWTNLPFKLDVINQRYPKYAGRVQLIPEEELQRWRSYESGPWDFFAGERGKNIHILIDEAQNYFADEPLIPGLSEAHEAYMVKLDDWMGQYLRKNNASFEAMTQSEQKLTRKILGDAGVRRRMLTASETTWFGFRLGDVVGFWSKLYGKKQGVAVERIEVRKGGGKGQGAWALSRQDIHWLSEHYWQFYNSYNKPGTTSDNGVKPDKEEWEILTWPSYIATLFWRYFILIAKATSMTAAAVTFIVLAGRLALSVGRAVGSDPKTGKPKAVAAEPTPVDDPEFLKKLEAAGLSRVQSERLEWPPRARNLIAQLEKDNRRLTNERERTANELAQARSVLSRVVSTLQKESEIVAVTPTEAIQADGRVLRVGEVISGGLFDGRKIDKIDGDTVLFDGGLRVRPALVRRDGAQGTQFEFQQPGGGNFDTPASVEPVPESGDTTRPGVLPSPAVSGQQRVDSLLGDRGDGGRVSPLPGTSSQGRGSGAAGRRAAGANRGVRRATPGSPLQPIPAPEPVGSEDRGPSVQPEPTLAD